MRTIIKLTSTAGTGHFYTTTRNPKLKSGKLELRKYDQDPANIPCNSATRSTFVYGASACTSAGTKASS